ncbi:hypothetical protein HanXRQr2_Chr10g0423981 [Helianthus annuus]|uniref:Uncharacterized protein n=1 Tax=Helianthus annuus TaxID=4232 RepID=A0A9K3N2U7_HELAN|nr:hypothetical protein HanXRQr2_Chr10g0423981 [Helianthus annuus]
MKREEGFLVQNLVLIPSFRKFLERHDVFVQFGRVNSATWTGITSEVFRENEKRFVRRPLD